MLKLLNACLELNVKLKQFLKITLKTHIFTFLARVSSVLEDCFLFAGLIRALLITKFILYI